MTRLRVVRPDEVDRLRRDPVDARTLAAAAEIVTDVRERGFEAMVEHGRRLGDLPEGAAPIRTRDELEAALAALDPADRACLERTAERVTAFARAQKDCLVPLDRPFPGGAAGHEVAPVDTAGCYAPGGRFPLPSSVLMTACTARAAGVETVWVASPRPAPVTLAAAAVAGADALLAVGGAQAIAALAYGAGPVPACDAVVGPGNAWVTAAKQLVAGRVAIDMLAGPSELVVLADGAADPERVAADLLAQAEHDPQAWPVLVTTAESLIEPVQAAVERQLAALPTRPTAEVAVQGGLCVLARDLDEAAALCDGLAPEHLQLELEDPDAARAKLRHYGALFLGADSAEVLGDYGAGPNHTLPTGGTARFTGGLSVLTFLRVRTWLRVDDRVEARQVIEDAVRLARLEGLEAHARAAEKRL